MARRRAKLELTLFPFMSVLCGLIAVMVLMMIVTLSTRVLTVEAVALAPPPPDPNKVGGLEDNPDAGPPVENGIDPDTYKRVDEQIARMEAVLDQQREARDQLQRQIRDRAALVKKLELERIQAATTPKKGLQLGERTPRKMIPAPGPNANKKPVFIEVSLTGYLVHPEKTTYPPVVVKEGDGKPDLQVPPELARYLEALAREADTKYPLLLVYPNGAEAFSGLRAHLEELKEKYQKLSMGWEPFSREWVLDNK